MTQLKLNRELQVQAGTIFFLPQLTHSEAAGPGFLPLVFGPQGHGAGPWLGLLCCIPCYFPGPPLKPTSKSRPRGAHFSSLTQKKTKEAMRPPCPT